MIDDEFREAVDEFILRRINDHGKNENTAVQDAYIKFKDDTEKLKESLNQQQRDKFIDCENSYSILDGETVQFYYRAGFFDAFSFLLMQK